MTAYADSGVIAKLYVPEPNSPEAVRLVSSYPPPLALTHLQALEVRNALRLKVFRGEMTRAQLRRTLSRLAEDVGRGRWQLPRYPPSDVHRKAEELSGKHARNTGCRSLDILHVAGAIVLGARDFLTFDARQGKLARKARLRVLPATA